MERIERSGVGRLEEIIMSKNESTSRSKTAIWVAVVTGIFTLFGTIITVIVGPIIQQRLTTPTPPTPTQAVVTVTHDTPTATLIPPTNTPTLTPIPTTPLPPIETPTTCSFNPSDTFYRVWQAERSRLGCALNEVKVFTAEQPFENGFMFWREDRERFVYVLCKKKGTWQSYVGTFQEGDPETGGCSPPPGLQEPRRGFGQIWRDELGGLNSEIGWATSQEQGFPDDRWVDCEQGMMLWSGQWGDSWGIFVFYGDGTWQLSK
jgi:hypothetical protein